jgi:hypothetical protein
MMIVDPRIDPAMVPVGSHAVVVAESQEQYRDMPSIRTPGGQVITRWALSTEEKAALIRGDDLFLTLLTFGGPVQPVLLTVGMTDWHALENFYGRNA